MNRLYTCTIINIILFYFLISQPHLVAQSCGGNIFRGCSGAACILDPDGDGDIVQAGTGFTNCGPVIDEMSEFEDLRNPVGCVSCQLAWTKVPNLSEEQGDLWAGGSSCGTTDIAPASAADDTYAYYTITDPDGICNNGDEMIIFRIRAASSVSGSFSFSVLIDSDNRVGAADPDGVQCASKVSNPGFEYEVIANPANNRTVDVLDINGVVGSGTVVASYSNTTHYNQSNACQSICGCNGGSVYHTFAVALTDIGKSCSDQIFGIAGGTASSGAGTISANTSVADIGGISGEPTCPDATVDCDCCTECANTSSPFYCGGNTSVCLMGCLNSCIASFTSNALSGGLPVTLLDFNGVLEQNEVHLFWTVASELNNDYYEIERSTDGVLFETIGTIKGGGTSTNTQYYSFIDYSPQRNNNYYRLKQTDFDGSVTILNIIVINYNAVGFVSISPTLVRDLGAISLNSLDENSLRVMITDVSGRALQSFITPITSGMNKISFDSSEFVEGIYLAHLEYGENRSVLKFIKTYN